MSNSSNTQRFAPLRRALTVVALAAVVFTWDALCKAEKSTTNMAQGSVFGAHGLSDAIHGAMDANPSNNGGLHGPSGSNRDGVSITSKKDSVHTPLNLIPDSPDAAPVPPPADLSLLAGRTTEPARRPLRDASMGGQYNAAGITGYAGIFIP